MGIIQSRPECSDPGISPCLGQVMGINDRNGDSQYEACVAMFGTPVTTFVTPSVSTVFFTETSTVSYTDVVIETSTVYETDLDTVISYSDVLETVTDYTATDVETVSTTTTIVPARKRGLGRRSGSCHTQTSTSSSSASSSSSSSTPAWFALASDCPTLEEYSSACSCVYAVSTTSTITAATPTETSVVTVTASDVSLSTSTAMVVSTVTVTIVEPEIVTLTSTELEVLSTTTTATSTTSAAAATITTRLVMASDYDGDPRAGRYIEVLPNGYLEYINSTGVSVATSFTIISSGGQPSVATDPTTKLYAYKSSAVPNTIFMETDAASASRGDSAVTCSVDAAGIVSCNAPTGRDTFYTCGTYLFFGPSSYGPRDCLKARLQISP